MCKVYSTEPSPEWGAIRKDAWSPPAPGEKATQAPSTACVKPGRAREAPFSYLYNYFSREVPTPGPAGRERPRESWVDKRPGGVYPR